jgi:hypothetical protein
MESSSWRKSTRYLGPPASAGLSFFSSASDGFIYVFSAVLRLNIRLAHKQDTFLDLHFAAVISPRI